MNLHPLNDAMLPRPLAARWVIRGTLTLKTALHLRGQEGEQVDMPVLRDARDGRPLLPGTTLAGALRNALADRLAGFGEPEPREVAILFGGVRGDDDGSQSLLIVFDAYGEIPPGQGVEIRDGVAISPATGVAEEHKKYDYEVLPAGTKFPVRADLLVPAPTSKNGAPPPDEKFLLEALGAALDSFTHGLSAFGAKRSRGLGQVSAVWVAKRFDLCSRQGWIEWALSDHECPFDANPNYPCIRDALECAAPSDLQPIELPGDRRKRVVIDLDLQLEHDILIRCPGTDPGAPDVSHLHSGGDAILPGTSLAGMMRAQALRIAKLVRTEQNDADIWVDRLFGPRFEGQRPSANLQPRASRLRVSEARFEKNQLHTQVRIAIDRFTQGVVETALFDEQTVVGGRVVTQLELWNPEEGELGLVLLVLKDLLDGSLPVGGTSSIGRGVFTGVARVTWHEGDGTSAHFAEIWPGRHPRGPAAEKIDKTIRAFHEAGSLAPKPSGTPLGNLVESSS